MTKASLTAFLILFFCVQDSSNIKQFYLFSKKQYSGNIARVPNGPAPKGYSTILLCFVEVDKDKPSPAWNTIYYDGYKYSVNMVPLNRDSVSVGNKLNTHQTITVKPMAAGQLFQLELTLKEKSSKGITKSIILEGVLSNKKVYYTSEGPVTELAPALMP
jgi:cellobiose phosphorylase